MQHTKIWWCLAILFPQYVYGVGTDIELEPCFPAIKNEPCIITCRIPNFTVHMEFKCNGSSRGYCTVFGCSRDIFKEEENTFRLQIHFLSYTKDSCEWTCTYGSSSSASVYLPIFSGFTGGLGLTSQKDSNGVKLTATANCLYPYYPSVDVMYSYQIGWQYKILHQQVDILQTSTGNCSSDIEKTITAIFYVSGHSSELKGRNVFFRIQFLQYVNGTPFFSDAVGPFFFEEDEMLEPNSEYKFIFYGVSAVLCISIVVNGCTITWILRQRLRKRQLTRGSKSDESPNNDPTPHTGIYDIPEDNAGYQELSHVTGRSHYDQLQRPN